MKKHFLFLIAGSLSSYLSYAQNNFPTPSGDATVGNGNAVKISYPDGKVGAKLMGNVNYEMNNGPGFLQLYGSMIFDNGNNLHFSDGAGVVYMHQGGMNSSTGIVLNAQSGGTTYFNGGNVGIGTTTPGYKLEVNGNMSGNLVRSADVFSLQKENKRWDLNYANGALFFDEYGHKHHFAIQSGTGNIGIGTDAPKAALEIAREGLNTQGPVLELTNSSGGTFASSEIFFSTYNRGTNNPSARIKVWDNAAWGGNFSFDTKDNASNGALHSRMFIHGATGKVGIGTTDPDQLLSVNGSIHAKEVIVDTSFPAVPDYVFDKGYKLRSLAEVEKYIVINKHLPEVPSAQTMAKEGIKLTEMNLSLLKKVEELTLYIVKQEKRIEKLERQAKVSNIRK